MQKQKLLRFNLFQFKKTNNFSTDHIGKNLLLQGFAYLLKGMLILFLSITGLQAQVFTSTFVENSDGCSWPWSVVAYNNNNELFGFYEKNSTYKLVQWNGNSWSNMGSFTAPNVGTATSLGSGWAASDDVDMAIDGNGTIHVTFRMGETSGGSNSRRGVFYGKTSNNGGSWSFAEIKTYQDPSGWLNTNDPLIRIDGSNKPHIAFLFRDANDPRKYAIKYTRFNGSSWGTLENAFSQTGISNEVNDFGFDLDGNGKPHIAFQRGNQWYRM